VRSATASLSVSHQQMVEIAKAVARQPRILILDEPSAALSREELKRLFALIQRLKRKSTLILYISHRLDEVFEIADRITVLKDGETVGTVLPAETTENQLIKMMVGRPLEAIYPKRKTRPGETLLEVECLSQADAFADVSFSVARGEILGFFGLVGSGRSAVARCIFAAEQPTSGSIRLKGRLIKPGSPNDAVKAGIALLTEDRKRDGLVMSCYISDNTCLATLDSVSRWIFMNLRQQNKEVEAKVRELSIRPAQINKRVRELSGGIDLSIGPIVALTGIMAAGLQAYMWFPFAIIVALVVGMTVGAVNGFLIARFKLQPFIVTLATMGAIRGLVYVYSETPKVPVDPAFRSLLGGGFIGPLPVPALILTRFGLNRQFIEPVQCPILLPANTKRSSDPVCRAGAQKRKIERRAHHEGKNNFNIACGCHCHRGLLPARRRRRRKTNPSGNGQFLTMLPLFYRNV